MEERSHLIPREEREAANPNSADYLTSYGEPLDEIREAMNEDGAIEPTPKDTGNQPIQFVDDPEENLPDRPNLPGGPPPDDQPEAPGPLGPPESPDVFPTDPAPENPNEPDSRDPIEPDPRAPNEVPIDPNRHSPTEPNVPDPVDPPNPGPGDPVPAGPIDPF